MSTPVFPLNTPLLPGCRLPLQIFEQRYLDMVSRCMREGSGFVVTLLRPGSERQEVNRPSDAPDASIPFFEVGTLANIIDFGQRDNGLLSITIEGQSRQSLTGIGQQQDGLWIGDAAPLIDSGAIQTAPIPELAGLLEKLLLMSGIQSLLTDTSNITDELMMNYLVMLLPMPTDSKQSLIEIDERQVRWQQLLGYLESLGRQL